MNWSEKKIKSILIDYLLEKKSSDNIICSEVPFLGGRRWVDILELRHNSFIAYEIKSDLDSLNRLNDQIRDYISTFNEVYIVLSNKFKDKYKILPKNIGYFWIDYQKSKIIERRKAQSKTKLNKKNLSYFLWEKDILSQLKKTRKNKVHIRNIFTKIKTTKEIHKAALSALKNRYKNN